MLGAPIVGDAAVLSAGLDLDMSTGNALGVTYDGQLGSQMHAIKGSWSEQF